MNATLAIRKRETTVNGSWQRTAAVVTSRTGSALPHDMQTWDNAHACDERTHEDKDLITVNCIFSPGGVHDLGLPTDFGASMRAARAHFGC